MLAQPPKPKDLKKLDAIDDLMRRKLYDEALTAALEFTREQVSAGWELLAEIAVELNSTLYLWTAARALNQLEPLKEAVEIDRAATDIGAD